MPQDPFEFKFNQDHLPQPIPTRQILRLATEPDRACLVCRKMFKPLSANGLYCSPFCRRRAFRVKDKQKAKKPKVASEFKKEWIADPTLEMLAAREALILSDAGRTEGFVFCGNVPTWQPSDPRIAWGQGVDDTWNMLWLGYCTGNPNEKDSLEPTGQDEVHEL